MDNDSKLEFWKQQIDSAAALQLPSDFPPPLHGQVAVGEQILDVAEDACKKSLPLI
eukprot:m.205796 g.205796  ORF g.205796 m.205796 type:complete len:56 (-) comp15790_c0_seq1:7353-7520(-)